MATKKTTAELNIEIIEVKKDVETLKKEVAELKPLQLSHARQEEQYNHILQTLAELRADVQELKKRPVRIFDYIITVVIAAVISYVFTFLGK